MGGGQKKERTEMFHFVSFLVQKRLKNTLVNIVMNSHVLVYTLVKVSHVPVRLWRTGSCRSSLTTTARPGGTGCPTSGTDL